MCCLCSTCVPLSYNLGEMKDATDQEGGMEGIGSRVRDLRRRRAFSMRALAEEAEVSVDALQRVEAYPEGGTPRPSTIRKVAKGLGVEPEYLTEGAGAGGGRPASRGGARAEEMMLAFAARGRANAEGRDAVEVYRELRENPPTLADILGGALGGEVSERLAKEANAHLIGPDPRSKERVPEGEEAAAEISAERAGHLRA